MFLVGGSGVMVDVDIWLIFKKFDFGVCVLFVIVMVVVVGLVLWFGGWWWNGFVVFVVLGVLCEWIVLVWGFVVDLFVCGLWNVVGIVYVGFGVGMLVFLWGDLFGYGVVLIVVGVVVVIDIGVYFVGWMIGGFKIVLWISLLKIWVGFVGGIVGVVLVLVFGWGVNLVW